MQNSKEDNFPFWKTLMMDERGHFSMKRLLALIAVIQILVSINVQTWCYACNAPSDVLIDALVWIIIVALGSTSVDKFSMPRFSRKQNTETDTESKANQNQTTN